MRTSDTTKGALRRRTILAAALSALSVTGAAGAVTPARDLVDLQVIDRDTGQAARVWRHAGRLYVAGRPDARYSLRVTNNTGGRVLVVMSVDGVNILTGDTASFDQRGYVFSPYETYDLNGWRKSDDEVAAFTFAPLRRSYAARTGRPNDVGVIGIAAFTERATRPRAVAPAMRPQPQSESASDEVVVTSRRAGTAAAAPPPTAAMAPTAPRQSQKLGTGHGAREWSQVVTVAFERATPYPQQVRRIEYDSRENLVLAGVIPRAAPAWPQPFPASPDRYVYGYVPDPPR